LLANSKTTFHTVIHFEASSLRDNCHGDTNLISTLPTPQLAKLCFPIHHHFTGHQIKIMAPLLFGENSPDSLIQINVSSRD